MRLEEYFFKREYSSGSEFPLTYPLEATQNYFILKPQKNPFQTFLINSGSVATEGLQLRVAFDIDFSIIASSLQIYNIPFPPILSKPKIQRTKRYQRAATLLREWIEEESDYDINTWPDLEKELEDSSARCQE